MNIDQIKLLRQQCTEIGYRNCLSDIMRVLLERNNSISFGDIKFLMDKIEKELGTETGEVAYE